MAPSTDVSLLENAVEAAAQVAAVSVADFSALQQAAAAEHSEAADPANASSTAAAALGSKYPTLHVPQSTEESFAAQSGADSSFSNVPQPDGITDMSVGAAANGVRTQERYQAPSAPKPTVGSEEWHKMRKDNHKEGL